MRCIEADIPRFNELSRLFQREAPASALTRQMENPK